jgi:hypothetical protein
MGGFGEFMYLNAVAITTEIYLDLDEKASKKDLMPVGLPTGPVGTFIPG